MDPQPSLIDELARLEQEGVAAFQAATDASTLDAVRIEYLGRKDGLISRVLRRLGALPADERPSVGAEANRLKHVLQQTLEVRKEELASKPRAGAPKADLTLPSRRRWTGAIHPVSRVMEEIWGHLPRPRFHEGAWPRG